MTPENAHDLGSAPAPALGSVGCDATHGPDETPADPPAPGPGAPAAPGAAGRLGRYRLLRELGRGGMGAIYLAEDEGLGRQVALKVMLPAAAANPTARSRFLREARAAAAVEHDHVVTIHHVGEEAGVPFIVMPVLKGETLADRLRGGRLAPAEAARVAREVALGLAAAHARGLIHRDVKPANVWLETGSGRVKVLDFGLARPDAPGEHLTADGAVLGTPAYMAPEQAGGLAVDARADLFSLGCVLYESLTGRRPFDGPTVIGILAELLTHTPPAPAEAAPGVPAALSEFTMRLLAKTPSGRPDSAAEVADALRGSSAADALTAAFVAPALPAPWPELGPGAPPAPPSGRRPPRKPGRPRWQWVALAAGFFGLPAAVLFGVILKVTGPDGKETTVEVPAGATAKVDDRGNVEVTLPKPAPKEAVKPPVPAPAVTPPVKTAGPAPLDLLKPADVPAAYRTPELKPHLVAVFGSNERSSWGGFKAAAFSPDGKTIATAGADGVRLWDAATLARKGHVAAVGYSAAVAFSPDGKTLAVYSEGWKTRLIDLTKPEPAVAHTLDGVFAARPFDDAGRLHLARPLAKYDLSGLAPKKLTADIKDAPEHLDLWRLVNDHVLTHTARTDELTAWHLRDDVAVKLGTVTVPAGVTLHSWTVGVSADGQTLYCAAEKNGKAGFAVFDCVAPVPAFVVFYPMKDYVVSFFAAASAPDLMHVNLNGHPNQVYDRTTKALAPGGGPDRGDWAGMALSADGKALAYGFRDRLNVLDGANDGKGGANTPRFPDPPLFGPVGVTGDGRHFVQKVDNRLYAWPVGRPRPEAAAIEGAHSFAADRRGAGVAATHTDAAGDLVTGFDPARPTEPLFALHGPGQGLSSWNGDRLALPSAAGKCVEVHRVDGGKLGPVVARVDLPEGWYPSATLSPDNRYLAVDGSAGRSAIWKLTGETPERLPVGFGQSFAFLPGDLVAVEAHGAGAVRDLTGRTPERPLPAGPASVTKLASAPDGRLAVSYLDGSLWVWDAGLTTVAAKLTLPGRSYELEFSPDGRHLLTFNPDGTSYVLRIAGDAAPAARAATPP